MAFNVPVENYVRSPYPSLPESKERYIQEELKKLERTLGTVSGALNDLKDVETQEDDLRAGAGFNTEVSLASAATTDIGGAGSLYVAITGTTTITSFGTNYSGPRFLRFTGALTLTHSASLVLPGGSSIVTAAGDTAIVVPQAAGWRVVSYTRADGTLTSNASFGASLGTNGYQRLPSGLIMQWGRTTMGTTSVPITFPVAFSSVFNVVLGQNSTSSSGVTVGAVSLTATGFSAVASTSGLSVSWVAFGN